MSDEDTRTSYVGANLSGMDLRHHDFSGKVMFSANLRGSKLYGARISLTCDTFDGVQLDDDQIALLLLMIGQADIDLGWSDGIENLVRTVAGEEKLAVFRRYLNLA